MKRLPAVKIAASVSLAVGLLASSAAIAEDWAMYRGPDHNGISAETGWMKPGATLKVAWTAEVGTGCASITVVGNRAYAMGNIGDKDTVFCLDAATGKKVWEYRYAAPLTARQYEGGPNATPTVADGKVYTFSKDGQVHCLDAEKGVKVWAARVKAKAPRWGYASSPLVLGKLVILNSGPAGLALSAATGQIAWDSGTGVGGYSTGVPVTVDGKTQVLLMSSASVLAVNPADGKVLWKYPWQTRYDVNAADPVVIEPGKKIFVSSGYGTGCALLDVSGAAPKALWRNKEMRNKHNCSVVYKGVIYGFDESKKLVCLDLATGAVKWTEGGFGMATLMLSDGKLIALSERGRLVIAEASPDAYKEIASIQAIEGNCWSVPVLANGKIYAKSKKGALACITVE